MSDVRVLLLSFIIVVLVLVRLTVVLVSSFMFFYNLIKRSFSK